MEKYFTIKEVMNILKVSQRTVYYWLREGKLNGVKAGKHWRISKSDLEKFLGRPIPWNEEKEGK